MSDSPAQYTRSLPERLMAVLGSALGPRALHCYGIEATNVSLLESQVAFLDLLASSLLANISTESRVLLCGPDMGELARRYESRAVFVFREQPIAESDNNAEVLATPLDILKADSRTRYDAILLEGSYHYLDQLKIFQHARSLLTDGGRLLLAGEFLIDDSRIEKSPLPNLSSCCQLAERLGFAVARNEDYSTQAVNTLTAVRELLTAQEKSHGADRGDLEAVPGELDAILAEFASGRRALCLIELVRSGLEPGEYADAEYGDISSFAPDEIASLFEKSFDTAFDPALWHWKYRLGRGRCVVAREQQAGPVVSHYGGAPRQIHYFGTQATAIQVCDVMVLPEKRQHYGKSSLFFKTAATFLEREIGNTVEHLLGFGFPNQKAMKIALRLGLYEKTDDFIELVFSDPAENHGDFSWTDINWQDSEHLAYLDALWQTMAADFDNAIIGVRHAEYLTYRYRNHPGAAAYRCGFFSKGKPGRQQPFVFVVLKTHAQDTLLMDLVTPLAQVDEALTALRSSSVRTGDKGRLKMWLTRGWAERLRTGQVTVNELNIEIPCNSWNPGPSAQTLYGAWWLTAGDMDFM